MISHLNIFAFIFEIGGTQGPLGYMYVNAPNPDTGLANLC